MFHEFLQKDENDYSVTYPFLNRVKIYSKELQLFTDSSSSPDLGVGMFFAGEWHKAEWSETSLFDNGYHPNIALLELLAIMLAVEVWSEKLTGKSIVLRSNNIATVCFLNCMKVDIPAAMDLLRHVTKTCLSFQIHLTAEHMPGKANLESDWLSRGMMSHFYTQHPTAERVTHLMPASLWPLRWMPAQMERFPELQQGEDF